eukprot:g11004.t1
MSDDQHTAFNLVTDSSYREQCVFFLNAFWSEFFADEIEAGKDKAHENLEDLWKDYKLILKLDNMQHTALMQAREAAGKEISKWDEHNAKGLELNWAFKFFEEKKTTMTAVAFKAAFKSIDANCDGNMSMVEHLLYKYNQTVVELLKRPQATTPELEAAKAAVKEVHNQIDKIESKKEALRKKAEGSGVAAGNAKAELHQLSRSDFAELNVACVKAEEALKKAAKKVKTAPGAIWFMQREIAEKRKYEPPHSPRSSATAAAAD